MKKKKRYWIR